MKYKNNPFINAGQIKTFGHSMMPLLLDGDIVKIKKIKSHLIRINDIVCFAQKRHFITHRVVYKTEQYIITKGDNNPFSDGKIKPDKVLGKVHEIKRAGQTLQVDDLYLLQSSIYFEEIKKVKNLFEEHKIDFLILKGLPLHLYYENRHPQRIYADCDILVDKKQYTLVEKIFLNNNYQKIAPTSLTGKIMEDKAEITFYKNVNGVFVSFDIHREVVFLMTRVGAVEKLYPQRLVNELTRKFLDEKVYIEVERTKFPILNLENLLVYLLLHIYHHNFEGAYRYEFLQYIFKKRIDHIKVIDTVKKFKLWNFVHASLSIYRKYYDKKIKMNPMYIELGKISNVSYIERRISEINIFNEGEMLGEGNYFRMLFSLSPNPLWMKLMVVFNGKILYSIIWVLVNKTRRTILLTFPFL